MRQYLKYIWIFVSLAVLSGCSFAELDNGFHSKQNSNEITIIGRITNFKDCNVDTRGPKEDGEDKISSMTMAIFPVKEDGKGLSGNCVYYAPNKTSTSFTIDRGNFTEDAKYAIYVFSNLEMPEYSDISELTLSTLLNQSLTGIDNLGIPGQGFPMIGSLGDTFSTEFDKDNQVFVLCPTNPNDSNKLLDPTVDGQEQPLLQIPMKALYAKINFTIEVNANQTIEGNYYPEFTLDNYVINNVPTNVSYNSVKNDYDNEASDKSLNEPIDGVINGGIVAGGVDRSTIEFSFYIPERLLDPVTTSDQYTGYPFEKDPNIDPDLDKNKNGYHDESQDTKLQRYKPRLLDKGDGTMKPATNVVISGKYRDHQNHYWDVSYTIYLGADNYGDFNVLRNNEYNNIITIKGIETSSDNLLVDHRVNIEYSQPAKITLLREVLLDSHFEVRPLRIKMNDIGEDARGINAVMVEVVDPNANGTNTPDWMRIERSFGDGTPDGSPVNKNNKSIYIDEDKTDPAYGKRRYFTYDLVQGTSGVNNSLVASTQVVVPITAAGECVWIYVDECTEVGDGVRSGAIKVSYGTLSGTTFTPANDTRFPDVQYLINQRKLFEVKGGDSGKTYHIEFHEEYLHNYDSDENYGKTEYEGMKWGLEGVQLSYDKDALFFETSIGILDFIINFIKTYWAGVNPQYDFYISKHDKAVSSQADKRDYSGFVFSKEIIQDVNGYQNRDTDPDNNIDILALNEQPSSAIEYCFNKNKRNAEGQVVWENGTTYDQSQLNWYLPAVDEIEDIVMSEYLGPDGNPYPTYVRFSDFRAKYYWSSQPSYIKNFATYDIWYIFGTTRTKGEYYYDDVNYARSTSVSYDIENEEYYYARSGVDSYYHAIQISTLGDVTPHETGTWEGVALGTIIRQEPGNRPRTSMARVRCVRKSADTVTE